MQKCFIIDINRCTGCHACQIACETENNTIPGESWRNINTFNSVKIADLPVFHLSLACNHCADPPCMKNCPAAAYSKDVETGVVHLNPDHCMGCKYCSWVCPYDAPKYNARKGVMEKCTLCNQRINEGGVPACADLCPTGALGFGDVLPEENEKKRVIPGLPETGINPSVKIKWLRKNSRIPDMSGKSLFKYPVEGYFQNISGKENKVSAKTEMPLMIFTLLASILTAIFTAGLIVPFDIQPLPFIAAGILGMGLTILHLGNKKQMFRSLLNLKNSWISREIAAFFVFVLTSGIFLYFLPHVRILGWAAVISGFFCLYSMDKVYQIRTNLSYKELHSAMVFITGLFLLSVFSGQVLFVFIYGLLKSYLYIKRKIDFHKDNKSIRILLSSIRLQVGLLLPFILWQSSGFSNKWLIICAILIGEIIDRAELYMELDLLSPQKQIAMDQQAHRT